MTPPPRLLEPTPHWTADETPTLPGSAASIDHSTPIRLAYFAIGIMLGITGGLGNGLVGINLPQIQGHLGLTPVEGAWLSSAYLMTNISSNLVLFKFRQQFGLRRFAEIGLSLYALFMLLHVFVDSFAMALVVRAVSGFAAASASTLAIFYVLQAFPKAKLGQALVIGIGIAQLATPLGWLLSPALLDLGEWRTLYLFESGLALCSLAAVVVLKLPPGMRIAVYEKLDFVTFALLAPALALIAGVLTQGRVQAQTIAAQASATPAATAQADPVAQADGLAEIVVTAQRRSQSLQNVPIAITALTAADLDAKQIRTTIDLPRLVPNMVGATNVGIGSANTYFIRGLGNTESIATFDPPVGTYVDDIYVSRQNANNFAFFDIDRIEVLRGPQGTLFGRNTTGGAINVILKKPSDTLGGYAEASYGRYNEFRGRASIDLPISDKVLTKFSAFGNSSDGYVYNRTTGEKNNGDKGYGVRAAVRLLPTDAITWDISADYVRSDSVNVPSVAIDGKLYSDTGLNRTTAPLASLITGEKAGYHLQSISKSASITSNLQFDTAGGATISLITGYRDLRQGYLSDLFNGKYATGGFAIANQGRFRQFSQEVKANGKLMDGKLEYVAGVFYIHESNKTDFADVFTVDAGTFGIPLVLSDRVLRNTTSAPAVYAQLDYSPVKALTVTVGARYTDEKKQVGVTPNANPALFGVPYGSAQIAAAGIPLSNRTRLFTPRVAVEYRPDTDLMLFASATRGFRSGGWNARALTAAAFQPFGPEKVWSYETGFRSELADRKLRLNATAFYTDVKGFQVPLGFLDSTGAINFVTQNGSDYRDYGVEGEILYAPAKGISLFANIGLQRAKYLNPDATITAQQASCRSGVTASCGQGIVDPSGNLAPPQRTPKFTAAFGGSYDATFGAFVLTPSANATYQSRNTVGTAGVPGDYVDGEWVANASLFLKRGDSRWKVGVECSNCFNNLFVASNFPPGFKFYNMPMVWRITTAVHF